MKAFWRKLLSRVDGIILASCREKKRAFDVLHVRNSGGRYQWNLWGLAAWHVWTNWERGAHTHTHKQTVLRSISIAIPVAPGRRNLLHKRGLSIFICQPPKLQKWICFPLFFLSGTLLVKQQQQQRSFMDTNIYIGRQCAVNALMGLWPMCA